MDDATLAARQCASQTAAFVHNVAQRRRRAAPGRRRRGDAAAAVPERSLPNSVVYADADARDRRVLDARRAADDVARRAPGRCGASGRRDDVARLQARGVRATRRSVRC